MKVAEVQAILGITDKVEYLNTAIPLFEDYASNYCNQTFIEPLPGGVQIFVAKACEYNMQKSGLSSRSMGSVSYSYETDFPPSLLKLLKPYRKVGFN